MCKFQSSDGDSTLKNTDAVSEALIIVAMLPDE